MKIRRSFEVGVTGSRALPQETEAMARIRREVNVALGGAMVVMPSVEDFVLYTPLAEGADRLVAWHALGAGYRLVAPLPFAQAEYERDFTAPESLDEFRQLLSKSVLPKGCSAIIELPGVRGEAEAASYGAVGQYVVQHSALMIAIWNGRPGKGPGGTADTVRYALQQGVPVWWVDALGEREHAVLLTEEAQLQHLDELARQPTRPAALRVLLTRSMNRGEPAGGQP